MLKTTLLLVSLAAGALAQYNLTGKWDVVATPEGKKPLKLDAQLKHDGADLSGQVNSPMGSGPVKNAVLGDPDVAFQFLIGKYLFDVKAVANGEELKGTFNGPRNMKGMFLAKRMEGPPLITPVEGVETGKLGEAEYRIDIPNNFNGNLVLYCHGYSPTPGKFQHDQAPDAQLKAFLDSGYAVAQSGYSKGGWAVKEGMAETETLRKHFVSKYGKPKRTFVTGHSMGGTITLALAESYPEAYDAALQMCGPIAPIHSMFQRRMFDTLVVYDYYFPGMIGTPVEITDDVMNPLDLVQRIQKEATQYPDRLMAMQKYAGFQSDLEMAQVIAFYAAIQKELMLRAGGNAFDNRNTLYQGTPEDGLINRGVKRYEANPAAVEYLKKYYTPTAAPKNPILSLHTTYDPLVPAWSVNGYTELLYLNGGAGNFVQRFVSRNGHCTFTPQETMNAFADLVKWKETGTRPEGGEQK